MPAFRDLRGFPPFGRLTVDERGPNGPHGHAQWWCDCACGARILLPGVSLYSGRTQSCGCLHTEIMQARNTTHGLAHLPEYSIWQAMKRRCNNPKHPDYRNYGGRGITVCDAWQNSFLVFLAEMGPRPASGLTIERASTLTIERVDNDGPYSKTNCVWTSYVVQGNNRRVNRRVTYEGKSYTVAQLARHLDMSYSKAYDRFVRPFNRTGTSDSP